MSSIKDITGQRFGRLVVIGLAPRNEWKNRNVHWVVKCDCGAQKAVGGSRLRNGNTKSCGCLYSDTRSSLMRKMHKRSQQALNNLVEYESPDNEILSILEQEGF